MSIGQVEPPLRTAPELGWTTGAMDISLLWSKTPTVLCPFISFEHFQETLKLYEQPPA